MNLVLSDRMEKIVGHVKPGSKVADIGTDHGYVPIWLVLNHVCQNVILSDINQGPLEKAKQNIRIYAPDREDVFDLRMGDGMKTLRPGEADTVIIAGMGGNLIQTIMTDSPEIAAGLRTVILQPGRHAHRLRRWLRGKPYGFVITDEEVAREGKKFSEIIILSREEELEEKQRVTIGRSMEIERDLGFSEDIYEEAPAMYLLDPTEEVRGFLQRKIDGMDFIIDAIRTGGRTVEAEARMKQALRRKACFEEMKKEAETSI